MTYYVRISNVYLKITARDARIFMVLEDLRVILHSHSTKLNTLLRHHSVQEQDQAVPEGIHFPVKEMKEMDALETKLMDPDLEKKVVSYVNSYYLCYWSLKISVDIGVGFGKSKLNFLFALHFWQTNTRLTGNTWY